MFWVIQNNIFREQNHAMLLETLQRMRVSHVEVKLVPFYDLLLPVDFDSHTFKESMDNVSEVSVDDSGLVMVSGGLSLAKIGKNRSWQPGSFLNENFHYDKWKRAYGENLLNFESMVDTFSSIEPMWNEFFIRPCEDTKDFDGTVFTKEEFNIWRHDLLRKNGLCTFENAMVVASPIKKIYREYRFFIVDNCVVTYSQYKLGNQILSSADVDFMTIQYVQRMINIWQPARAFVMDIALTSEGLRIIEINNINSAGFYDCNVGKFINAIENMIF